MTESGATLASALTIDTMIISVTRLRVRLVWHLPPFLWWTYRSQRQVMRASGFRGGRLLVDAHCTLWTLTSWEDERAMKAFRAVPTLMRG